MSKAMVYLSWERDGVKKSVIFPMTESYTHQDLTLTPSFITTQHGQFFTLYFAPSVPLILKHLSIHLTPEVRHHDRMMLNGYQTWTQSREMGYLEHMPPLRWFARPVLGPYGDYNIRKTSGRGGHFNSWTYTYFSRENRPMLLFGSADESFAYTVFNYDFRQNLLIIEKELEYLWVSDPSTPFRIYLGEGKEREVWDEFALLIPKHREEMSKCTGWTSWYYYYTKITEEIILKNLHALQKAHIPLDVFQIDDGYQEAVGDWLTPNKKFPNGLEPLATEIKNCGYRPGIWLAPFICESKSELFKNHPEWLLRKENGKPIKSGFNPNWSGWFYSLDFYAPGVKNYLRRVFETVFDEWGFEMVKLDFLYAVAVEPREDKTRGQIMSEALAFIREIAGDKWILGCGVPLGPSFGQLDYCRIGSDVAPYWEDSKLDFIHYRERVSTLNSLLSTIGRWQLNGRLFLNDPDVFILRDNENKLTEDQKHTLFLLNNLLGGLVFFSDHVEEYTPEQITKLKSMFPTMAPQILSVTLNEFCYQIKALIGSKEYHIYTNLSDLSYFFKAPQTYFSAERGYISPRTEVELKPHQTVCMYLVQVSKKEPYLLGTTGHIFPGVQVTDFITQGDSVEISLVEGASPDSKISIGVPIHTTYIKVNGKQYAAKLTNTGARYVSLKKSEL